VQRHDTIVLPKTEADVEINFTDSAMVPVVVAKGFKRRPFSSQPYSKPTQTNLDEDKKSQCVHNLTQKRKLLMQASEIITQSKLYKSDT